MVKYMHVLQSCHEDTLELFKEWSCSSLQLDFSVLWDWRQEPTQGNCQAELDPARDIGESSTKFIRCVSESGDGEALKIEVCLKTW